MWTLVFLFFTVLSKADTSRCKDYYVDVGAFCVQLVKTEVPFPDAKEHCKGFGGKLVQISSLETLKNLMDLLQDGDGYWVEVSPTLTGQLHNQDHDQGYSYNKGPHASELCHIIFKDSQLRRVNPLKCEDKIAFICAHNHVQPQKPKRDIRSWCQRFCFQSRKAATTKKPPATPPQGTVPPPNLEVINPAQLNNMSLAKAIKTTEELVNQLQNVVKDIWIVPLVAKASDILTQLMTSSNFLTPSAQVNASDVLLLLSEQFSNTMYLATNISMENVSDSANSLFQAFDRTMRASLENYYNLTAEQVNRIHDSSFLSVDNIEYTLLTISQRGLQSYSFSSSVSSLTVARVNATDLITKSFTTEEPAVSRVTFPVSAVPQNVNDSLKPLNVQVLAMSINPFCYASDKEIIGPVVNIHLSNDEESLEIHDLSEFIKIVLVRNESSSSNNPNVNLTKNQNMSVAVNVTSVEESLVVTVKPDIPVPLVLYLGFQVKANSSHFMENISVPNGKTKERDDGYTWVLPPEKLNGSGTYYITVSISNQSIWNEQEVMPFFISVFATQCVYWNYNQSEWSEDGCQVGPQSTMTETQCLCNHLTFFGSTFFVMPHVVDLSDTLSLFANVTKNPVGLALLGALIGFYLLVVVWAWKKDKEDVKKVRVAILTDNDPAFHFRYVIKVCTGYRKGAGTTSQVVMMLYGSEGQSDPHILSDPEKEVFTRGAVDVFLLKTRFLGELHSLRLWHSNSGSSPSWYVHRVSVTDLAAQKTWYFLCDSWLASDLADCQLDRIFPSASKGDLMSLRYLLLSGSVEKFLKDHLWLSVWTRCPWSPFTRVQRICCCMSLLFCSLVINIMFWNLQPDEDSEPGQFFITLTQIKISFQSSLMLVPVNLLIVQMFQLIQVQIKQVNIPQNKLRVTLAPKPCSKEASTEQLLKDLKDIVDFLHKYIIQVLGENPTYPEGSNKQLPLKHLDDLSYLIQSFICVHRPTQENSTRIIVRSPQQCIFLHYLYRVLENLMIEVSSVDLSYVSKPSDYIQAANVIYDLREHLQNENVTGATLPSSLTTSFPVTTTQRTRCSRMPKAFTYMCWVFLFAISAFSAYYMVLISLDMTKEKATSWLISMLLSFFQSLFVLPPIKALAQMVILFRVLRKSNIEDTSEEQQLHGILSLLASRPDWELSGWRDQNNPVYQAPANKDIVSLKKQKIMERKLYTLIHDIIVHIVFLVATMIATYAERSPNEYMLNKAMQSSFSDTFSNIRSIEDFYSWSWGTLLPNLYGNYPGFITDGNSFLVGSARIRQLRRVLNSASNQALYDSEDTDSYGPGWVPLRGVGNQESWWVYHTETELGGYPIWAQLGTYSGDGYVVELGMNSSSASSVLTQLKKYNWLDSYTKVIFLEFNVYNANVNLFCLATLILEVNVIGDFSPSADLQTMRLYKDTSGQLNVQFISDMVFVVIFLYIVLHQILRLKTQKCSYFRNYRNLLDLSIVAISCCNTGLYVKRKLLHQNVIYRYHLDHTRFVSFYETAVIDSAQGYGSAFLVALMIVKLWRLLNLNPNLHLITMTLRKAWTEIGGFLFTILILLIAYSITCNLLFGWCISSYRTVLESAVTIISLLIGIFDYEEVLTLDPVLGSLLITTCVIFLIFVVVNIFLSALLGVFSRERQCPTPYEEKEIVDLLLLKLSGLFGIRKKQSKSQEEAKDKEM
ncbi:polycystic kidney disease protein 1-like 3 [Spea bombifrons]|uniref:polycystic kidney disease protein 1-like 3 n=1 Tax=Spea bombifrons TaxID=233779 RepID=UPI00234ACF19|nr:polycystic kidney disease protein 1-like 3 [Spea bombifrons]